MHTGRGIEFAGVPGYGLVVFIQRIETRFDGIARAIPKPVSTLCFFCMNVMKAFVGQHLLHSFVVMRTKILHKADGSCRESRQ